MSNKFDNMQILYDRVIVTQDEAPDKVGSIYVPQGTQEQLKPLFGTVMAVGPGRVHRDAGFQETTVKVGDRVCFNPQHAQPVRLFDQDFLHMPEANIIGIVKEEKDGDSAEG